MDQADSMEFKEAVTYLCHKFRTPLATVNTGIQVLLMDSDISANNKEILNRMLRNAYRIEHIMEEVLNACDRKE